MAEVDDRTMDRELFEWRTAERRCICCGILPSEQHHGQWWCDVCVGREHHFDGPWRPGDDG